MSASSRSSSRAVPKCMKRPPDQVPSAVCVGSRAIAVKGTRRAPPGAPTGCRAARESGRIAGMRRVLVLLVMVVALVAVGCGGDDNGGGGGGGATSKQDYRQKPAAGGPAPHK